MSYRNASSLPERKASPADQITYEITKNVKSPANANTSVPDASNATPVMNVARRPKRSANAPDGSSRPSFTVQNRPSITPTCVSVRWRKSVRYTTHTASIGVNSRATPSA